MFNFKSVSIRFIGALKTSIRKKIVSYRQKTMGNMSMSNKALDKYFGLLSRLDNSTKKRLIIKLTESLELEKEKSDLKSLFGAWEDSRESDEIIKEIRESRVNKMESEGFE